MASPYDAIGIVPSFALASTDVADGGELSLAQVSGIFGAGGQDVSPQLSWSGFPSQTKSFAVTLFDPDAPSASGFWHWSVADIPVSVTELPTNAGAGDESLPEGAWHLRNDASLRRFLGAAPPKGEGRHTYAFAVHALDVETLGLDHEATPALHGFQLHFHTLARGVLLPWYALV
jgi:Raf kinase inhibitor-like YbhB/YbcL family protein